jgi:hypothetical protein
MTNNATFTSTPTPLVTRAALEAFTQRLVEHFAPEQVILFGSWGDPFIREALDHGEVLYG